MSLPAACASHGSVVMVEPRPGAGRRPFTVDRVLNATPAPGRVTLVDPDGREVELGGAELVDFISLPAPRKRPTETPRSSSR